MPSKKSSDKLGSQEFLDWLTAQMKLERCKGMVDGLAKAEGIAKEHKFFTRNRMHMALRQEIKEMLSLRDEMEKFPSQFKFEVNGNTIFFQNVRKQK